MDYNPLYREKHQAQMFGRGHIAGIDPKQQLKSSFYHDYLQSRQTEQDALREKYVLSVYLYLFNLFI